ncbi:hypothetical protein MMC07_009191 [Pseudocyphellaria aurata]|nr:hypothetical protein [Pseudocyphellaria aurata]
MPQNHLLDVRRRESAGEHREPLLGSSNETDDSTDILVLQPLPSRQQSSITRPQAQGLPRASRNPNRVHFDIQERKSSSGSGSSEDGLRDESSDEADKDHHFTHHNSAAREGRTSQRASLLTHIQAPSVTVANANQNSHLEGLLDSPRPKSGMMSAFMNMANSIIGAGIIGQPYAFRQAGLMMAIILLVVLTVTVDWTIQLIVINSKLCGTDSFQATMEYCFGRAGLIAISVAQWAFAFGGMVAFCIIVGDTIPHVMTAAFPSLPSTPYLWLLTNRKAVIIVFILGISFPLSLYRDISKLAKASTLALISMSVIIITIIIQGERVPPDLRGDLRGSLFIRSGIFQAIGVISFAFVCHHNSLLIYGSLKEPTMDRFAKVTHYSTSISMAACLTMALAGFLTFGAKTQGNVLNNFPTDNIMINIARLCFGLNMLTTLPLEAFVCREVMTNYWFPGEPWNPNRHLIFTTSLVICAMTLALITCDLGAVFELIGATSACALAYMFPPLCYIKLSSRSWRTIPAAICVAFGVAVMGISLIQAVSKLTRSKISFQSARVTLMNANS